MNPERNDVHSSKQAPTAPTDADASDERQQREQRIADQDAAPEKHDGNDSQSEQAGAQQGAAAARAGTDFASLLTSNGASEVALVVGTLLIVGAIVAAQLVEGRHHMDAFTEQLVQTLFYAMLGVLGIRGGAGIYKMKKQSGK